MNILGIDPGNSGGLALLNAREVIERAKMPLVKGEISTRELYNLIALWDGEHRISMVAIEHVTANACRSKKSAFTFGRGFGILQATVTLKGLPYRLVAPQTWTKKMHQGVTGKTAKDKSLKAASRLFPNEDLDHDGIVDALLIARYCLLNPV